MSLEALVAVADEALAGLEHRRFDFDVVAVADALRPGFAGHRLEDACAWCGCATSPRRRQGPDIEVREVPYDAVHGLRRRLARRRTSPTRPPPPTSRRRGPSP